MMMRIFSIAIFASAVHSSAAHAAWDAGWGFEGYRWQEIVRGNSIKPTESGVRYAVHLTWTQDSEGGLLPGYRGKLYAGQVNYDTYIQQTGAPVSTKTDYGGAMHEGQLFYRVRADSILLDYAGGLGFDTWRRTIGNSGSNQIEDYFIAFLRAGINFDSRKRGAGMHGGGGLKYPFWTWEDAHLDSMGYESNPIIAPGKSVSFYAELGYRINKRLDVTSYYDSWRFKQSEMVTTTSHGILVGIIQPESSMDALGMKIMYSF